MRRIEFDARLARPIDRFESSGAASVELGHGQGEAHVYCLHFEPGGQIGPHEAGFDQLFLVVSGEAWAAGADALRLGLRAGEGVYIRKGELHAKGSDAGGIVMMIQATSFPSVTPHASTPPASPEAS